MDKRKHTSDLQRKITTMIPILKMQNTVLKKKNKTLIRHTGTQREPSFHRH